MASISAHWFSEMDAVFQPRHVYGAAKLIFAIVFETYLILRVNFAGVLQSSCCGVLGDFQGNSIPGVCKDVAK